MKDPRYFQDEAGEFRYAVDGDNGENMATSEGYTTQEGAERGFVDLTKNIVDWLLKKADSE